MAYLFTRIPLVNATQPFVGGSGVFEVTKGRTGDTAGGKAFAFDINVACGSSAKTTTATTIKRSIVSIHIFNVGNRSRYPNNSILFASGLVVFGTSTQAMSFHADASDIRKLAKGESIEDLGTMFCQYIGTAQKYLERPMPGGGIDGLLEVGLPLQDATAKFKTYALIKAIPKDQAADLKANLSPGMIVEVRGQLAQIGFGADPKAPIMEVRSLRSLPAPTKTSSSTGTSDASQSVEAETSTSETALQRIRSVSPVAPTSLKRKTSSTGNDSSAKKGKQKEDAQSTDEEEVAVKQES